METRTSQATDPTALAHPLSQWMGAHRDEMLALLERLVRAESPSRDAGSQRPVLDILAQELESFGFANRILSGQRWGGQLFARPKQRRRRTPCQLLLGHADTVWPRGTLEKMGSSIDAEGRMRGPGVYDMKAGLVQTIFALRALSELGCVPTLTPILFVNSDEEIGSYDSTARIRRLARVVERCFVMEPSLGTDGRLKTARKGVGRFRIQVHGRAAHAGLDPESGVSAILELTHVIQELSRWNDPERGISVNVGEVEGGTRPNVIAAHAEARMDVRVPTHEAAEHIEAAIYALESVTPGAQLEISGHFNRQPMEPTTESQRLWQLAHSLGQKLGIELEQGAAGGASDGNTTSQWTPTLDGLGAVGDGAHADHEFVFVDRMGERAALLALLVAAPSQR